MAPRRVAFFAVLLLLAFAAAVRAQHDDPLNPPISTGNFSAAMELETHYRNITSNETDYHLSCYKNAVTHTVVMLTVCPRVTISLLPCRSSRSTCTHTCSAA